MRPKTKTKKTINTREKRKEKEKNERNQKREKEKKNIAHTYVSLVRRNKRGKECDVLSSEVTIARSEGHLMERGREHRESQINSPQVYRP